MQRANPMFMNHTSGTAALAFALLLAGCTSPEGAHVIHVRNQTDATAEIKLGVKDANSGAVVFTHEFVDVAPGVAERTDFKFDIGKSYLVNVTFTSGNVTRAVEERTPPMPNGGELGIVINRDGNITIDIVVLVTQ